MVDASFCPVTRCRSNTMCTTSLSLPETVKHGDGVRVVVMVMVMVTVMVVVMVMMMAVTVAVGNGDGNGDGKDARFIVCFP